jgi:hypothetical protein
MEFFRSLLSSKYFVVNLAWAGRGLEQIGWFKCGEKAEVEGYWNDFNLIAGHGWRFDPLWPGALVWKSAGGAVLHALNKETGCKAELFPGFGMSFGR